MKWVCLNERVLFVRAQQLLVECVCGYNRIYIYIYIYKATVGGEVEVIIYIYIYNVQHPEEACNDTPCSERRVIGWVRR